MICCRSARRRSRATQRPRMSGPGARPRTATGAVAGARRWSARGSCAAAVPDVAGDDTSGWNPSMVTPAEIEAQILRYYHAEKWKVGTIAQQLQVHHSVVRRGLAPAGLPPGGASPPPPPNHPFPPLLPPTPEGVPTPTPPPPPGVGGGGGRGG